MLDLQLSSDASAENISASGATPKAEVRRFVRTAQVGCSMLWVEMTIARPYPQVGSALLCKKAKNVVAYYHDIQETMSARMRHAPQAHKL